jgi:hypothetical protein
MHITAVNIAAFLQVAVHRFFAGAFQQTISGLSVTNQDCYELTGGCYSVYGFEYKPGCSLSPLVIACLAHCPL